MGLDGVTWFRQAAFRWEGDGPVVYVDPWGVEDDVPADVILITHAHFDGHLQPHEVERLRTPSTTIDSPARRGRRADRRCHGHRARWVRRSGWAQGAGGAGLQHRRGAPGHASEVERLGGGTCSSSAGGTITPVTPARCRSSRTSTRTWRWCRSARPTRWTGRRRPGSSRPWSRGWPSPCTTGSSCARRHPTRDGSRRARSRCRVEILEPRNPFEQP